MTGARTGVLLSNLGTPDSPTPRDVRRYLREFLSDPRVIDLPALPRWLLVNLVVAPFRPRRSAAAYQKIWGPEGSPLLAHGRALRAGLARALGPGFVVALGMRYGRPSIPEALAELAAAGVGRIVALPLYPQWAESSTGSTRACLEQAHRALPGAPPLAVLPAFFDAAGFVEAFAAVARPVLSGARPDHVLFSYHGLPERQVKAADPTRGHCLAGPACCDAPPPAVLARCYRAQCLATTRALARALALEPGTFSTSFQSRLGPTPWIRPFTDHVLPELAANGVKRLAVLCPSFVADCLETLEEIGIRGREQWLGVGGEDLSLVPSLNAHPRWVEAVAEAIRAA
jgi:ferrochelatase